MGGVEKFSKNLLIDDGQMMVGCSDLLLDEKI